MKLKRQGCAARSPAFSMHHKPLWVSEHQKTRLVFLMQWKKRFVRLKSFRISVRRTDLWCCFYHQCALLLAETRFRRTGRRKRMKKNEALLMA